MGMAAPSSLYVSAVNSVKRPIARYATIPSGPIDPATSLGNAKTPGPIMAPMPIMTAMKRPTLRLKPDCSATTVGRCYDENQDVPPSSPDGTNPTFGYVIRKRELYSGGEGIE
jgi:hypothetical protein